MPIENIMYFALGALASALMALIIMPAVWRRAVRLTRRRIEAATPMTLAEFRADKDQLRSEFALTVRRLEQQNEHLRERLAEEMGEADRKRTDLTSLRTEHRDSAEIIEALESRLEDTQQQLSVRESEIAELLQDLEQRAQVDAERSEELAQLHQILEADIPPEGIERSLSGDYEHDVSRLLNELSALRRYIASAEMETDNPGTRQPPIADSQTHDAETAGSDLSAAADRLDSFIEAEAPSAGDRNRDELLAERLGREDIEDNLQRQIAAFEADIADDPHAVRQNAPEMRRRLLDIAETVGDVVRGPAPQTNSPENEPESLFERIQRFAEPDDGEGSPNGQSDRDAAAREIRSR
ncbi:hypothetical protein GCM10007989_25090 [Devosia pacifica]|uniref:Uncharacterized protein n=1 Tax=Devosia pacifica TaxID=1335967 RepID=A0A918S9P0_9HYPH|nr:hypothetical protein [Devosia pacifica]GHA28086.1 hypothetical protein GCM10007989_25090 [Devosia pacifica]